MKRKEMIYMTPMPVRIWHWLNAFGIVTLCITGLQIRFPDYINVFGSYKAAIRLHNTAGVVVSISYLLWLTYYIMVAKNLIRIYVPTMEDLKSGVFRQICFYALTYFQGKPNPHHSTPESKFNPIQKLVYLMIMIILLPLVIFSGVLLMYVAPLRELLLLLGGIKILVGTHFLLACCFTSFLFVHIYLATLGHTPLAHFKPMWNGWEEEEASTAEPHEKSP
ncbi:MAG: cytochrome b/b6 domain-containing protein [Desulfuromonadaceae bacterium]|nr:cytochrome b/b6 domain-containing protein [Desulfuromonadaceae bacterium]MDD2855570.1 cytochrome b/b6 domain-containing protein [Desulfuromonadaceae bacterium]